MDHWLQRQPPDRTIHPEMPVVGLQTRDLDIGDDVGWIIKRFPLEGDTHTATHSTVPSITASQIASLDRLTLACMLDLRHYMISVLLEFHQLAIPFHLQAKGREPISQGCIGIALAHLEGTAIRGVRRWG